MPKKDFDVPFVSFQPEMLRFLEDLAANNNREWFHANKGRYEAEVVEPVLGFVRALQPRMASISPHYPVIANKTGGAMMRIYRDVRFSQDKSPYKTQVAVRIQHALAKTATAPGFYLHMHPGEVFLGVGCWQPEARSLAQIRKHMDTNQQAWREVKEDRSFLSNFELGGSSLKRAPRGYPQDHPLVEDLKRKDFVGYSTRPVQDLFAKDFVDQVAMAFASARPLMQFLSNAVGVPF